MATPNGRSSAAEEKDVAEMKKALATGALKEASVSAGASTS